MVTEAALPMTPEGCMDVHVAVRTLAEFQCRSGDIHRGFDGFTEAHEGVTTQARLQLDCGPAYVRERRVSGEFLAAGVRLRISGRIDGFDPTMRLVEEFKASRVDARALHAHAGSAHLAQLKLYAALLARENRLLAQERVSNGGAALQTGPVEACATWQLRLVYAHPDTLALVAFDSTATGTELETYFDIVCGDFCAWVAGFYAHRRRRDAMLADVRFPFTVMRDGQRTLARHTFRACRDGGTLWVEAPTGSGKTLGTLFPALKSMPAGGVDRVVYLTSRGTGQQAALAAVDAMSTPGAGPDPRMSALRSIVITARDKICFQPEPVCDPALCPYARGYYDRRRGAVAELVARGTMTRATIESVARARQLCPFELSLDAAVWADVVICDYNYVFDPTVALQRITGMFADRTAVLIDETHQLADRVRDALSAQLDRATLIALKAQTVPATVRRAAAALDRRLLEMRRVALGRTPARHETYDCELADAHRLAAPVDALVRALIEQARTSARDADLDTLFALLGLQRTLGWFASPGWLATLDGSGGRFELQLRCLDPAPHIAATLKQHRAAIGFSATLTPLGLFQRLHGLPDARTLRVASPFDSRQLGVFVLPDVDTRMRARVRSLDAMVDVIEMVVRARPGNYLVSVPSYTYLNSICDAFRARCPDAAVVRQWPAMDAVAREAFLAAFHAGVPITGFAVHGGVFTESIDLPGDALIGIIVVGVGLPPPTLARERLAEHFRNCAAAGTESAGDDAGALAAYLQPAMTRVVQAAGRLIRAESDRGVLCLVDDRFLQAQFRRFFPAFWRPEPVRRQDLATKLDAFWNTR
jgi:DNA excision repair protein ERCC-2